MKYERWLIPETDDAAVEALMDAGYPYLVSTVLASRGVVTPEQAAAHLDRERSLVYSPFLMRDMDKAVARIDRALAGGETIAVFGDYDVDGITSTCLLTDYLRSRGAAVLMHIPRRIEEGYGLGCDAIRALAEQERAHDNNYRLAHLVGKVARGEEHTRSVLSCLYRVVLREIREDGRGDYVRYRYGHGYNESDEYRERLRADGVDNKVVVKNSAVEQDICYACAEKQRLLADLARQYIDERIGHYADAY